MKLIYQRFAFLDCALYLYMTHNHIMFKDCEHQYYQLHLLPDQIFYDYLKICHVFINLLKMNMILKMLEMLYLIVIYLKLFRFKEFYDHMFFLLYQNFTSRNLQMEQLINLLFHSFCLTDQETFIHYALNITFGLT